MNIIFLFDSTYPYYTGGIETWIYNVCERLILDNNITILTVKNFRKESYAGEFHEINPKIRLQTVTNMNHIPFIRFFVHKHIAALNSLLTAYNMYKYCTKFIQEDEKYFVIALGTVFMPCAARKLKKKYRNIKIIASCRGPEPELTGKDYPGLGFFAQSLQKINLKRMDEIWSNGIDTKTTLENKGFKSKVIKNGVDFDRLRQEVPYDYSKINLQDKIIIATIGSVSKIKGYMEIIEAVSILKNDYKIEVHFVGVGKVSSIYKEKYIKFAGDLGVENQIHLIGEHRNVVSYAKGADVMICASGGGGYGMSILESMLSETPVVAWNNAVHTQLLENGRTAVLVKAWDSEDLAKGVKYILEHRKKAKKLGKAAAAVAKDFDWDIVVNEIRTALASL